MTQSPTDRRDVGVGILLNPAHVAEVGQARHRVDWLELVAEDFFRPQAGGFGVDIPDAVLDLLGAFPVGLHGVELSIGSVDPFDLRHLDTLKELVAIMQPRLVTDHLCWTGAAGQHLHELMPLPYERTVAEYVAARIRFVQDRLGVQMCFENPPNYVTYAHSDMTEAEFMTEIAERSDSYILLDVNNLHVSASNNGYDPVAFLATLPAHRVKQIHLAGHGRDGAFLTDDHGSAVADEVWKLYALAVERFGPVATNIEWDRAIPSFDALCEEVVKANHVRATVAALTA